jgi:hypothetical protein
LLERAVLKIGLTEDTSTYLKVHMHEIFMVCF